MTSQASPVTAAPGASSAADAPPFRRRTQPSFARYLTLPIFWLVFVPISKVFGRRWARGVGRLLTRFLGQFPSYEPTEHDVFVCAFFKSGTNWTMQIAVQAAHRGRAEFEHIHDVVPWPEFPERMGVCVPLSDQRPRLASPTGLRVIKTHLTFGDVPYSEKARYICLVRDPKDVFVSSYHFLRGMGLGAAMPSVPHWLDVYLSPDAALGSWAEHVNACWRMRDRPNVLFLTYEQMRRDLPGAVDKIAALMGVKLTADERAAVIERSSFAYMKKNDTKFEPSGPPWRPTRHAMIRRGESGKSGEMLSPPDQRRIDDYCRAELEKLGCDFPYEKAFGGASGTSSSA